MAQCYSSEIQGVWTSHSDSRRSLWNKLADRLSVRRLMQKHFLGFGAGSRKCLGQNIALWLGQKLVVQVRFCAKSKTEL